MALEEQFPMQALTQTQELPWFLTTLFFQCYKPYRYIVNFSCGGQFDRHEQSKDNGPGTEGHQGKDPWVSSKGEN